MPAGPLRPRHHGSGLRPQHPTTGHHWVGRAASVGVAGADGAASWARLGEMGGGARRGMATKQRVRRGAVRCGAVRCGAPAVHARCHRTCAERTRNGGSLSRGGRQRTLRGDLHGRLGRIGRVREGRKSGGRGEARGRQRRDGVHTQVPGRVRTRECRMPFVRGAGSLVGSVLTN